MLRTSLITLLVTTSFAAPGFSQTHPPLAAPAAFGLKMPSPGAAEVGKDSFASARQPERDSRLNGFLIGFVAGAVPGVLLGMGINSYCNNESSSDCPWAIPIVGGLFGLAGGGIGYAIDGAIHQSPTFARPRPAPSLGFSVRF